MDSSHQYVREFSSGFFVSAVRAIGREHAEISWMGRNHLVHVAL